MERRTIGKIQVILGIILIIATIVAFFYSNKLLLNSYNNFVLDIIKKSAEQRQYFQSNETLYIFNSQNVNLFVSLSGDYLIGCEIIIIGGIIIVIISVNIILQGLANTRE